MNPDGTETTEDQARIIEAVRNGLMSVRHAAVLLDWTVDDVCEAAFGEVTL